MDYSYLGVSLTMFHELFKNFKTMRELVDQIKAEYEVFAQNAEAQVEKGNKSH